MDSIVLMSKLARNQVLVCKSPLGKFNNWLGIKIVNFPPYR
ncbi:hypothetical protein D917_03203 [Trichinella nativa]|uniref:Uncharacterized protein n=1 Tax=Trichinella nativa TaxID=6335 RepID=A0A1Y3E986_9BILA|nr:hypothetical protein D917_03203 [Trichinella nativa]